VNDPLANVRLSQLPASLKLLLTLFLLTMSVGYCVALLNLYLTYSPVDGKAGLSLADLKLAFHGNPKRILLIAKIDGGSMAVFLSNPADKQKLLRWIEQGAPEAEFTKNVQPLFQANCVRCHSKTGPASFRPLTDYTAVMKVVQPDRGESLAALARVAHFHVLAFALIFLCVGLIFCCTQWRESVKVAAIGLPYVCIAIDFGARGLAKLHPGFVYGVLFSGALMGLSFGIMVLSPLYELWLKRQMHKEG
jgi:hypothetical protein